MVILRNDAVAKFEFCVDIGVDVAFGIRGNQVHVSAFLRMGAELVYFDFELLGYFHGG